MTTKDQAERREAFYADLRGGNFTQLRKEMRFISPTGEREHCCLGVAQERFENDPTVESDTFSAVTGAFYYKNVREPTEELSCLSGGAMKYYGFVDNNPDLADEDGNVYCAAIWNDREGRTFPEIADLFEKRYPAVADEEA